MATAAGRTLSATQAERIFFSSMAIALALFVFAGFAPTYFLLNVVHGVTASGFSDGATLTPLVHVHAFVSSAWLVLLVGQTSLVAAHRVDLHRRLGLAGIAVALLVLIVGTRTALVAAGLGHNPPGWTPPAFLMIPFTTLLGFALFAGMGVALRRNAGAHKRLMILATISLAIPAGARLARHLPEPFLFRAPIGGMILVDLFVIALVAYDLGVRRRLHPVTLYGGAAFLLSQPLRIAVAHSEAWQAIARTLIA